MSVVAVLISATPVLVAVLESVPLSVKLPVRIVQTIVVGGVIRPVISSASAIVMTDVS
jgi:hypothetical protein